MALSLPGKGVALGRGATRPPLHSQVMKAQSGFPLDLPYLLLIVRTIIVIRLGFDFGDGI
jgi:hypothetical protein